MKLKISDMVDHLDDVSLDIREKHGVSTERIKKAAMEKVSGAPKRPCLRGRRSRMGLIAAAAAAVLCITAGAVAVGKWSGFALTAGMSGRDKRALLAEIAAAPGRQETRDQDGTVHYLDESGQEILVLSPKEAAEYEAERLAAEEQAVRESTTLVDAATLPLMPSRITELAVEKDGRFADFALGNGSLVLLHPEGEDGFALRAGDVVTVSLTASDECYVQIGRFRDGSFVDGETVRAQRHSRTFSIEADGTYCFYVEYYSSDASTFTECSLTVR